MITLPTKFEQHHQRAGGTQAVGVVFLTSSSVPCYSASTRDMQIGTAHVHSHLISISGINEKVDLHTKKWATSDVTITLLNPRYSPAGSGIRDRVSEGVEPDKAVSLTSWAMVWIYLISGEGSTFTTDGIIRFKGRIISTPTVTEKTIVVRAQAQEKERHKILPTEIVEDTYPNAPAGNLKKRIAICYGDYTENYWNELTEDGDLFSGIGLAKALRVDSTNEPKYVISDHVLYSSTNDIFIHVGTLLLARADKPTVTLDDSGHGTFIWNFAGSGTYRAGTHPYRKFARQLFIINEDRPSGYTISSYVGVNSSDAHDFNMSSDVTIQDNWVDSSGVGFAGIASYGINEQGLFRESIQVLPIAYPGYRSWINLSFYNWRKSPARSAVGVLGGALYYAKTEERLNHPYDGYTCTQVAPSGFYNRTGWSTIHIGLAEDLDFEDVAEDGEDISDVVLGIFIRISSEYHEDGLSDDDLALISELRLEIQIQIDEAPLEAWVECQGREYGSWITEASRSIDSKSSGDLIENQAHIIESLLRDELGFATSDIDTASFDAAYDENTAEANRQARLNIYKEISSAKVIRQIAEQSTFAFTWTAAGKGRLIPLHSSYWSGKSVDSTIPWSHIKAGSLKVSKTKIYCNEVEVQSRWHGEAGLYRDTDTTTDSGSQTSYGAWRRSAKWPNVAGDTRSHVASLYVNSTNGLWSRPHLLVECETLGFTNAHLELGDCIQLDSTTVDPHLKAYDESWSGPKLCVIELQQKMDGTKIKAIELF